MYSGTAEAELAAAEAAPGVGSGWGRCGAGDSHLQIAERKEQRGATSISSAAHPP